jgi:hypothetical protein
MRRPRAGNAGLGRSTLGQAQAITGPATLWKRFELYPPTSTRKLQVRPYFLADLLSMEMSSSRGHPAEGRSAVVPGSSPEVQTMRPSRSRSAISTWAVTASITGDGVSVQVMR